LILEHGEQAVLDAGIDCLGFPGTWVDNRDEAIKLETYLYNKDKGELK